MNFLDPLMYDIFNIDMWKFKMSAYLKALRLHVYLAITKKSYLGNDKYLEANKQALKALKHTLSKYYLFLISHYDSAFVVWKILTSPKEQASHIFGEREAIGDEFEQTCYMI